MVVPRLTLLLSVTALMLVSIACKKKAVEVNEDLIGVWEAPINNGNGYIRLDIQSDSYGYYERNDFGDLVPEEEIEGTVRLKKSKLKIGRYKKFDLNSYPYQVTDTLGMMHWELVLDSHVMRAR